MCTYVLAQEMSLVRGVYSCAHQTYLSALASSLSYNYNKSIQSSSTTRTYIGQVWCAGTRTSTHGVPSLAD